jgi:hypothetical protein
VPVPEIPTGFALALALGVSLAIALVLVLAAALALAIGVSLAAALALGALAMTLATSRTAAGEPVASFLQPTSDTPSTAVIAASHASRERIRQKTYPMLAPKSQSRACTCTPLLSVIA